MVDLRTSVGKADAYMGLLMAIERYQEAFEIDEGLGQFIIRKWERRSQHAMALQDNLAATVQRRELELQQLAGEILKALEQPSIVLRERDEFVLRFVKRLLAHHNDVRLLSRRQTPRTQASTEEFMRNPSEAIRDAFELQWLFMWLPRVIAGVEVPTEPQETAKLY